MPSRSRTTPADEPSLSNSWKQQRTTNEPKGKAGHPFDALGGPPRRRAGSPQTSHIPHERMSGITWKSKKEQVALHESAVGLIEAGMRD
jgi:hypothetical protein